jgi:hypothetical protein
MPDNPIKVIDDVPDVKDAEELKDQTVPEVAVIFQILDPIFNAPELNTVTDDKDM